MSRSSPVPPAVPLLTHNSCPVAASSFTNASRPFTAVKSTGATRPAAVTALSATVVAAVPLVWYSVYPLVVFPVVKYSASPTPVRLDGNDPAVPGATSATTEPDVDPAGTRNNSVPGAVSYAATYKSPPTFPMSVGSINPVSIV